MVGSVETGRDTRSILAFAGFRRAIVQAAHVQGSDLEASVSGTPAHLLCGAQQLSDCKFWVRAAITRLLGVSPNDLKNKIFLHRSSLA
jgi:hypothetical protein